MLAHPRSTLRVLCRLMQLPSGHVTLLRAEVQPPKLSPQSDLPHRAASRLALPQISSLFLFLDILRNITQQLIKTDTHWIVGGPIHMRTEVKILQHNRLDANSFVSVKLWKQTRNCTDIFEDPVKILGTEVFLRYGGNRKQRNFVLLIINLMRRQSDVFAVYVAYQFNVQMTDWVTRLLKTQRTLNCVSILYDTHIV